MKKLLLILLFLFPTFLCAEDVRIIRAPVIVEEVDGSPTGVTTKIVVSNDTLTRSGTTSTINIGAGAGDVTSVGDCASGACFDGTSDGGTWIKFYDAQGAGNLTISDLSGARIWYLPDATGSLLLNVTIDTYAELNATVADVNLTHNGLINTFAELDAIVADKSLVNLEDGGTFTSNIIAPNLKHALHATITNGTNDIDVGSACIVRAINNFTAGAWEIWSTDLTAGTITVAVSKFDPPAGTNQNFTAANFTLCSGTENITLAGTVYNEDASLGSFNTTIVAGEYYRFNVTANTGTNQVYMVVRE